MRNRSAATRISTREYGLASHHTNQAILSPRGGPKDPGRYKGGARRLPAYGHAAADEGGDREPGERGTDPDEQHLEPAPPGPPHGMASLVPPDEEQGRRADDQRGGDSHPEVAGHLAADDDGPDDEERRQRDQRPDDRREAHEDRALPGLRRVHGGEVQLVGHHDLEPRLGLRGDL